MTAGTQVCTAPVLLIFIAVVVSSIACDGPNPTAIATEPATEVPSVASATPTPAPTPTPTATSPPAPTPTPAATSTPAPTPTPIAWEEVRDTASSEMVGLVRGLAWCRADEDNDGSVQRIAAFEEEALWRHIARWPSLANSAYVASEMTRARCRASSYWPPSLRLALTPTPTPTPAPTPTPDITNPPLPGCRWDWDWGQWVDADRNGCPVTPTPTPSYHERLLKLEAENAWPWAWPTATPVAR